MDHPPNTARSNGAGPDRSRTGRAARALTRTALTAVLGSVAMKVVRGLDDRAVINDPRGRELVPLTPTVRQTVTAPGGPDINVAIYGPDGAPTVVLAHGWTCAIDFWTPQIRALSAGLRVVAYDQRGHGRSGRPGPGGYTMDALADDLLAVLDACVPAGERVVLVGHSMGGFATLAFAGRHPAELRRRIAGVVLASTAATDTVADTRVLPGGPAALRGARTAVARAVLGSTAPTGPASPISRRVVRFATLGPAASPAQVAFCERIALACPPVVRGGFAAAIAQLDLGAQVAQLDVPTIVVTGTDDRLLPPGHSRRLAAGLPALVELVELPNVGHMTPVEAPTVVTGLIQRLVDLYLAGAPAAPDHRPDGPKVATQSLRSPGTMAAGDAGRATVAPPLAES